MCMTITYELLQRKEEHSMNFVPDSSKTISVKRPKNVIQWLRLHRLYQSAFPANEKKPFSMIRSMQKKERVMSGTVRKMVNLPGW